MIILKTETKVLLLSITKNWETLHKETHTKPQVTIEFTLTKSTEAFSFKASISNEGSWMLRLKSLELHNSIFNITEQNNKVELYTDTFDEFYFDELEDEHEEFLDISKT